jgi:hypothetical protein
MNETELLRAEVAFWTDRAEKALELLRQIQSQAAEGFVEVPPEPPVGTKFLDLDGEVTWERDGFGWHCRRDDCDNCPASWFEAYEWDAYRPDLRRVLPKDGAA